MTRILPKIVMVGPLCGAAACYGKANDYTPAPAMASPVPLHPPDIKAGDYAESGGRCQRQFTAAGMPFPNDPTPGVALATIAGACPGERIQLENCIAKAASTAIPPQPFLLPLFP